MKTDSFFTSSLRLFVSSSLFLIFLSAANAQESITISTPATQPAFTGHLKMGGKDPAGDLIDADSRSLTLDGKPIYPIMGEFHFTRYPHEQWERELLKMKAGGITVVSCYIIWIHHEEVEGQWDWTGDKDLRQFVQLCAKHGLQVWLRLGPWDHAEVRNGGLPDWVLKKCARTRTVRDTDFMNYTKDLYTQIFQQVKGLQYKDGGPIIGIQVDNEVRNDAPYLLALKNMAKDVGFDVPLYSQTGWGPAAVPQDELLPMFGGYSDGFWIDGNTVAPAARVQFFFTHNPNDENRRMNTPLTESPRMDYLKRYPFLTCETGDGMAISYARRPIMPYTDIASAALCKVGNGSNLMGYYLYHGGCNPDGKLTTLQESQATNYPNDMTEKRYDFQAPLGEYGQIRPVYHALRILHEFLADFGPDLVSMPSTLPPNLPPDMQDTKTLRWAVRSDGQRGYIFINNHERGVTLPDHDAQFTLHLPGGDITVPDKPAHVPSDAYVFWPFNMDLNGVRLRYATAQPVCKIDDPAGPLYVFMTPDNMNAEFAVGDSQILTGFKPGPDCVINVKSPNGKSARILLLNYTQAMHLWKANLWGADRLLMSPANLVFDDSNVSILSNDPSDMSVSIYPAPAQQVVIGGKTIAGTPDGLFTRFAASAPVKNIALDVKQTAQGNGAPEIHKGSKGKPEPPTDSAYDTAATWHVGIPADALDGVSNVLLHIDYTGDTGRAYIGDKFIDDDFYFGQPWEIGLKRFTPAAEQNGVTIKIIPLRKDLPVNIDPSRMPTFNDKGEAMEMHGITPVIEYELNMTAGK